MPEFEKSQHLQLPPYSIQPYIAHLLPIQEISEKGWRKLPDHVRGDHTRMTALPPRSKSEGLTR